jgi:hypothetical protein
MKNPRNRKPHMNKPRATKWSIIIALSVMYGLSSPILQAGNKGQPPPTPTPAPTPTPTPAPSAPPATPTPPPNTSRAANAEATIDNRFVTVGLQLGDGRSQPALDVYSNALIHSNARIATSQGFFTASQRGQSGLIQNPTPAPTPVVDPATLLRNDPPPKTAVDWGWLGNKKSQKAKK